MSRPATLAVLTGRSPQEEGILAGCRRYVQEHRLAWHIDARPASEMRKLWNKGLARFDGMIGFRNHLNWLEAASPDLPIATLGTRSLAVPRTARVSVDNHMIGRLVADMAQRSGTGRLALIGSSHTRGFRFEPAAEAATERGLHVLSYEGRNRDFAASPTGKEQDLIAWLHRQPKPLLAFLPQDKEASWFIKLCTENGIRVPEEVSILGVDDDVWVCESQRPHLSSIHIPWPIAGYQLALQMHRMLSGSKPEPILVAPLRVVERESTLRRELTDSLVDDITHYLEETISQAPRLGDLVARFGVSRQTIHRRFKTTLGVTTEAWWTRHRLDRALELLTTGSMPIADVGRACGFPNPDSFRQIFVRHLGSPPSLFRHLAKP